MPLVAEPGPNKPFVVVNPFPFVPIVRWPFVAIVVDASIEDDVDDDGPALKESMSSSPEFNLMLLLLLLVLGRV